MTSDAEWREPRPGEITAKCYVTRCTQPAVFAEFGEDTWRCSCEHHLLGYERWMMDDPES